MTTQLLYAVVTKVRSINCHPSASQIQSNAATGVVEGFDAEIGNGGASNLKMSQVNSFFKAVPTVFTVPCPSWNVLILGMAMLRGSAELTPLSTSVRTQLATKGCTVQALNHIETLSRNIHSIYCMCSFPVHFLCHCM